MKGNKRHAESAEARALLSAAPLHIAYSKTASGLYSQTAEKSAILETAEKHSKIGRRYSFDDNGGGYQGL